MTRIAVCSMLQQISRKLITRNLRSDEMDYIPFTIDSVEHSVVQKHFRFSPKPSACLIGSELPASNCSRLLFTVSRGRPHYNITRQQASQLQCRDVNAVEMAAMLVRSPPRNFPASRLFRARSK